MYFLPKDYVGIYIDIYSTKNLTEFTKLFVSAAVGAADTPLEKTLSTIAKAGVVAEPNSAEFLSACALSGSSVRSSLADLRERDLVYKTDAGYVVYDRLLGEWLRVRP